MSARGTSRPEDEGTCVELRREAGSVCAIVPGARAAAAAATVTLDRARARLQAAETAMSDAQKQGDPRLNGEAKAQAQRDYRRAMTDAGSLPEERAAVTAWMREIDRLNRGSGSARARSDKARTEVAMAYVALTASSQAADTERIRAESASDRCQIARQRLAGCEEGSFSAAPVDPAESDPAESDPPEASDDDRPDGTAGNLAAEATDSVRMLVIERLLLGEREALRSLAASTAEQTGIDQSSWVLLLQELIDGIADRAAEEGYLDFGPRHPFWSQFGRDEARLIIRGLASVGARLDGQCRWAGRRPGPADFAMALAHAGYDVRGVRGVPSGEAIDSLFAGVRVASAELLAARSSSLELEELFPLLGARAERLGELWDHWGHLRPRLLADGTGAAA